MITCLINGKTAITGGFLWYKNKTLQRVLLQENNKLPMQKA